MLQSDENNLSSKQPPQIGIGWVLNIYSVLLAVLPVIIVVAIAISLFSSQARDQTVNQMDALTDAKTHEIQRWLENSQITLELVLTNPDQYRLMSNILISRGATGAKGAKVTNFLEGQLALQNSFEELYLYNVEGDIRISSNENQVMVNINDQEQPYFEPSLEDKYIQPPYYDSHSDMLNIIVSQPIYHENGGVLGVIAGRLNLNNLSNIMTTRIGSSDTGETYLISAENSNFVTPSRFEDHNLTQSYHSLGIDSALSGNNSHDFYENYRGQDVLGVYRWIPELQSGMLAEIEEDEAFKAINIVGYLNIFAAGVAAFIAIVIAIFVTQWITRPIWKLTHVAVAVMNGDYNIKADIKRRNELGKLGQAFDTMTVKIRELIQSLEQRAKELHEKNVELERMDRLKDQFLANTSHELRTPINGIIGIADSMIDGATGDLSFVQVKNLEMVVTSGRRLSTLIDDILDFSKLQEKTFDLQCMSISLTEITEIVLTLSQPLIGSKPIELINAIPTDIPAIYADENRLQQILFNLIGNAIKFTDLGKITISASILEDTNLLKITVSDTGIGIPENKFEQIFQAFEQADGSTARVYGGTGLGLAVTKELVELHDGTVWVESTVGKGSDFSFTLPISDEPPESITKYTATEASEEKRLSAVIETDAISSDIDTLKQVEGDFHILVVDDELVNIQVLLNQLSLQNYKVSTAMNGYEALKFVKEGGEFDLVVLDVMMPQMSGYETCRKIRKFHSSTDLPIIMLTAKNRVVDLVTGFEAGANDYLTKPFSKVELLARIKNHLQLTDMRKLNASKDRFFSIVAHDLKGPFLPLLGLSELLPQIARTSTIEEIIEMAENINSSANNVYALLENLLSWSRIQMGRMPYNPISVNLQKTIFENIILLSANARDKDILLQSDVSKGMFVESDRNMLNTIVRNLTTNAIKFTSSGGSIIISAEPNEKFVEVSVKDTGVGIREKDIDKLFHIDVHHTTQGTNKESGTGLGLIMCKEMVEKNGGEVWVESELGKGTTVKFTVPLDKIEEATDNQKIVMGADLSKHGLVLSEEEEKLILPSTDELDVLLDLAMRGDMEGIKDHAMHIQTLDKEYVPFAQKISTLAQDFEDDIILTLIKQYT
ncbi:MAG: hypothetical protein B6242_02990 [Anaerolineaceae bacterium 4572_78]|nr:MAG: hypothetical protein B6242_02990 [Anaerolineaceae bacterium 4572_78]